RVPFQGEPFQVMVAHVGRPPTELSKLVEGVPPALEELVLKLLAKEPRARYGHADDVAAILDEILGPDDRRDGSRSARREASLPSGLTPAEGIARDYLYRPEMAGRTDVLALFGARLDRTRVGQG